MACLKGPHIVPPALPDGIVIDSPPLPPLPGFLQGMCCKIPSFAGLAIPRVRLLAIPGTALSGIGATLRAVCAFVDSLQVNCPLD